MPKFQDETDPIIDDAGVILYDRFLCEHIPQHVTFNSTDIAGRPLPPEFRVGGVYSSREVISLDRYVSLSSRLISLTSESRDVPHGPVSSGCVATFAPLTAESRGRNCFVLTNVRSDILRLPNYPGSIVPVYYFISLLGGDPWQLTEHAAAALLAPVPKVIVSSKTHDVQTRVFPESTVCRKVRSLQYRDGSIISNRRIETSVKLTIFESFNAYLRRIRSSYATPEEVSPRDLPASPAERTEVPAPEADLASDATDPEPSEEVTPPAPTPWTGRLFFHPIPPTASPSEVAASGGPTPGRSPTDLAAIDDIMRRAYSAQAQAQRTDPAQRAAQAESLNAQLHRVFYSSSAS